MLYLASQSPRRRALLRHLRRPFRIVRSTHREVIRRGVSPSRNAMRNARGKARNAVLPARAKGRVIAADTFLYFRGRVIGKPKTMAAAHRLLRTLSGRSHWVYTGVCLMDVTSRRCRTAYAKSRVTFRPLSDETIRHLFARSHPLDKAGGYALQADRGELIARIQGSRSNVIGLPLELLRRLLAQRKPCGTSRRATYAGSVRRRRRVVDHGHLVRRAPSRGEELGGRSAAAGRPPR